MKSMIERFSEDKNTFDDDWQEEFDKELIDHLHDVFSVVDNQHHND